jgi:hypothetical protein
VPALRSISHLCLSVMAKQVGLDPQQDIHWITSREVDRMELFAVRAWPQHDLSTAEIRHYRCAPRFGRGGRVVSATVVYPIGDRDGES